MPLLNIEWDLRNVSNVWQRQKSWVRVETARFDSKEPLSHNKKRSILVGIHTMCVWDDKTWLIYCFSLTFNFLLHWEFELSCQRGKKLLGMRTGREKVKGGILEADFCYEWIVFNLHSSLTIHCLHFTTATSIIFVLSAKITTPQRPLKPPKSTDIWGVMSILSLSL